MAITSALKKGLAFATVLALAIGCFALAGCADSGSSSSSSKSSSSSAASSSSKAAANVKTTGDMTGIHHAVLTVEGYDPIQIELDADEAPITVSNFVELVESGYYDGLALYRIQDGFVLQGGTMGDNAGGNDPALDPIAGEFSKNGYENNLADSFDAGVIAMARTNDPNSATSTFFITLGDSTDVGPSLNGGYAAFGTIDDAGMKIVNKIVTDYGSYATGNMGAITDKTKMPIIKSITITD